MKRPVIGITAGEITNHRYPWAPYVYGQSYTYIDAIVHAGGAPIILPILADEPALRIVYELCDGLLMSGGNDIGPERYQETSIDQTVNVSARRDDQELQLISWAIADDKPLLGICRGMQLLNVSQGGNLHQDIDSQLPKANNHHSSTDKKSMNDVSAHCLQINPDSKLATILKATTIQTNTHHHQAIKKLGTGLTITSRADDGIIETIELADKQFTIGVQSHPESLEASDETLWRNLFVGLVEAARAS